MNEEEIRTCGGELVAAVRPHVLVGIRDEDLEVAERIFSATTSLLLQVLVDINRIATALEGKRAPAVGTDDLTPDLSEVRAFSGRLRGNPGP